MLRLLLPAHPEAAGLLALLLVHHARRATRTDAHGRLLRLEEQDRSAWDRELIAEADRLVVAALRAGPPGRFTLQAAIAALHVQAPSYAQTDWPQILTLYDELLRTWPSPVVALNRAVAVSMVDEPEAALAQVEALERDGRLAGYRYLPAIKADLLHRLGRDAEAADAYQAALALTGNAAERELLQDRLSPTSRSACGSDRAVGIRPPAPVPGNSASLILGREQPRHRGKALVDVLALSGLDAIRQVLHHAAPGVEDGAVTKRHHVVDAGSIAGDCGVESGRTEVAVQQAEVAGRVDDGGVAPVDDAGDRPRDRVDQHVLDPQIIVGERGRVPRRWWRGGQEGLNGSAVRHRHRVGDRGIGLRGLLSPLRRRLVVGAHQRGHPIDRDGMQRGEQLAKPGGDGAGLDRPLRLRHVQEGHAWELAVGQATLLRDREAREGDRQRRDGRDGGKQAGLPAHARSPARRVGFLAEAHQQLAVDLVRAVVQALPYHHDGVDLVVGEVRSDHAPEVLDVVGAAVCHATILSIMDVGGRSRGGQLLTRPVDGTNALGPPPLCASLSSPSSETYSCCFVECPWPVLQPALRVMDGLTTVIT
jgi:hypothetical protein